MPIVDFFNLSDTREATHLWILLSHNPDSLSSRDMLARILADRIMEHLCCGSPHLYEAWKKGIEEGLLPTGSQRRVLVEGFVKPIWGTPEEPQAVPMDHIEAFVAEMLWYFLCPEVSLEEVIEIQPPHFKSTDPGADGLVIHRVMDDYLMFRLWEIKKFVKRSANSSTSISSTVNKAYSQLDLHAMEYLARYTTIGQESSRDPELRKFYGRLPELWIEESHQAAVGVSVTTSLDLIPQSCFSTFGKQFPGFVNPARLQATLSAIGDFTEFSKTVRRYVWKGLWTQNSST